jgi:hypothetical protein
MRRWLPAVLATVHELTAKQKVRFTQKALYELAALDLGLDETDALDVLAGLTDADSAGRIVSKVTGEWLYMFKPTLGVTVLYLKLTLRTDCVVISFHEQEDCDGE